MQSQQPAAISHLAWAYLLWEAGLTTLLVVLTTRGISTLPNQNSCNLIPPVSVLIAAYNESSCILETIRSVSAQTQAAREIIIASDGSSDGMEQLLIKEFHLRDDGHGQYRATLRLTETELILLVLPRGGKGTALNAALAIARSEVVVTLDADTLLDPEALAEVARPFTDQRTAAAGGFIFIRNAAHGTWITQRQYVEYLKSFLWRIGLAHARVCLQVSGAFGAFRRDLLLRSGGFCSTSLVEDYEIIYRLHRDLIARQADYRIVVTPQAIAYTDGPESIGAFIRQRTRWFAGFLQTLWDYREMIFSPRHGRIGLFMLPVKMVDAVLPIWGLISLVILLVIASSGQATLSAAALLLFTGKWFYDALLTGWMLSWLRRLLPGHSLALSKRRIAYCVATDGLIFHWFRQAAVLNAYSWMIRRVRHWEQARWQNKGN